MEDDQQFCLRWNNHQSTLISVFDTLLENQTLVDCTITAEGQFLKAHKVVLSACSPFFATLLQETYDKHPIFILNNVKFQELRAMMDYMYRGEVNISQDQLAALLKAAESLQIKGLSDNRGAAPRQEQPPRVNVPMGGKNSYTLETKRPRLGAGPLDPQDVSGSREGSSSPSRRRRKVRRRSMENDVHDNSNSSATPQSQTTNANLAGVSAITAAALASQMTVAGAPVVSPAAIAVVGGQQAGTTQLNANVPKKTDSIKGTSDAMTSETLQTTGSAAGTGGAATGTTSIDEQDSEHIATGAATKEQKSNHKQKSKDNASTISPGDMPIEPKSEYDEEAHDESVEDLTLDDEMAMEDMDHNAGTSQGGEGSSQDYAWQHDRSQDGLLLTTQEAQQRDPQDLTKKLAQIKNSTSNLPLNSKNARSLLNNKKLILSRHSITEDPTKTSLNNNNNGSTVNNSQRKRLSMSDVSDMLFEFYKANVAKAPKSQQQQQQPLVQPFGRQTSPTSAEQLNEPSSIAAIATNGAASETASKNLMGDEMMDSNEEQNEAQQTSFHPKIRVTSKILAASAANSFDRKPEKESLEPIMTAIPTSVLVPTSPQIDVKPLIHPTTGLVISPSVIKPVPPNNSTVNPQAAVIAAALIRDGYHSFQQQIRAQEILRQQNPQKKANSLQQNEGGATSHSKILENLLRQQQQQREQRSSECENEPESFSENNDGDDEDDSRYNGFDDIHLLESGKSSSVNNSFSALQQAHQNLASASGGSLNDVMSEDSQKFLLAQAQAQVLRNLEYSLGEYGNNNGGNNSISPTSIGPDGEPVYECRHCGKKYRWKSTLRRHENVECGGKEPAHQCPYCPYKSKQRGNLGVHVRKHHSNLPQLASKRRSKYSVKYDESSNAGSFCSGGTSDDSQSKLIIDCSK